MITFTHFHTIRPWSKFSFQRIVSCLLQSHFREIVQCRFMNTSVDAIGSFKGERSIGCLHLNPEKPDVPLNKNDAFQKVQKRHVQEKR